MKIVSKSNGTIDWNSVENNSINMKIIRKIDFGFIHFKNYILYSTFHDDVRYISYLHMIFIEISVSSSYFNFSNEMLYMNHHI